MRRSFKEWKKSSTASRPTEILKVSLGSHNTKQNLVQAGSIKILNLILLIERVLSRVPISGPGQIISNQRLREPDYLMGDE